MKAPVLLREGSRTERCTNGRSLLPNETGVDPEMDSKLVDDSPDGGGHGGTRHLNKEEYISKIQVSPVTNNKF